MRSTVMRMRASIARSHSSMLTRNCVKTDWPPSQLVRSLGRKKPVADRSFSSALALLTLNFAARSRSNWHNSDLLRRPLSCRCRTHGGHPNGCRCEDGTFCAVLSRNEFLAPLIGEPWAWQSRNCWDFACHVQKGLFGRKLPCVAVPADMSKRWILESIERHADPRFISPE